MRDISSLELKIISKELAPFINGSRVRKLYFLGEESFRITFYKDNKTLHLYIKLLKTINSTNYTEGAEEPNGFVMGLRKRLENRIVNSIEQKGSDRILQISIGKEHFLLIFEMLAKGNVILLDEFMKIELSFKALEFSDRIIKTGHEYKYPKGDSLSLEEASVKINDILDEMGSDKIISVLSRKINLGPLYIEDILNRSGVDPKSKTISEVDKTKISKELSLLSKRLIEEKPRIYLKSDAIFDYAVCEIIKYKDLESKGFETLNEMLDFIYLKERSLITDAGKAERIKESHLNIEKQEKLAVSLLQYSKENAAIGKKIFENMNIINGAIAYIQKNKRATLDELKANFPELNIKRLDLKSKTFTITLDD